MYTTDITQLQCFKPHSCEGKWPTLCHPAHMKTF